MMTAGGKRASPGGSVATRHFAVSVVGLSGTEREKGPVGVGKSCLCNRFVRPHEDDYFTDHISTLSQVDFGGSSVINNDHWLYWGERVVSSGWESESAAAAQKSPSAEQLWSFRVVEQTEFVDDESFQPLLGSGPSQKDGYVKRAVAIKLQSPDKLMYLCKDQLGLETEYEQCSVQPEGRVAVDGFVCVFDVSAVPKRPFAQQADFVVSLLSQAQKVAKKPVVLAATKLDEASAEGLRELERLLARKELRGAGVQLVETSAHRNVNVDACFVLLGHLIEKSKSRPRARPFKEAAATRETRLAAVRDAFARRLRQLLPPDDWPRRRLSWQQLLGSLGFAHDPEFIAFCQLFGRQHAQRLFRQYMKELRERWVERKLQSQAARLPDVFAELFPSLESIEGCQWSEIVAWLQTHPSFVDYFQPVGSLGADDGDGDAPAADDARIPAEILLAPDAELAFRNHLNLLEADFRRGRLHADFVRMLESCTQVTPGKPLSDVRIFFLGKEQFESLTDTEAQEIYDKYQRLLVKNARQDFVELLLEHVQEFVNRIIFRKPLVSSVSHEQNLPGLSERDMTVIHDRLQEDFRYRQLNRLFQARDNMICQYASFVSYPLRQHCPAGNLCVDTLADQLLPSGNHFAAGFSSAQPTDSSFSGGTARLNLGLLAAPGLAEQFVREIRFFYPHDLFEHGGVAWQLRYGAVEADGLHEGGRQPLVALFSSRASLDYLRDALARSLLRKASRHADDAHSLPPTLVLLGCDPHHLDDLPFLQQQGALIADTCRAPFVGVGSPSGARVSPRQGRADTLKTPARYGPSFFSREQLQRLLRVAVALRERELSAASPDLRALVCLMCGDDFPPAAALAPLFGSGQQAPGSNWASVEVWLPSAGRPVRIETALVAYHTALVARPRHPDAALLAYSTRRRASFAHLQALVQSPILEKTPILIVAIGEVAEFFSNSDTNALMTEGNELADRLGARFVTLSPAATEQKSPGVGSYTAFLEDVYEAKLRAESDDSIRRDREDESQYAALSEFQSGAWRPAGDTRRPNGDAASAGAHVPSSHALSADDDDDDGDEAAARPSMRFADERRKRLSAAPLATPELMELSADAPLLSAAATAGGQDADAVVAAVAHVTLDEHADKTTSPSASDLSKDSSLEKFSSVSPLEKSSRRPTPHKKKKGRNSSDESSQNAKIGPGIAERLRLLNQEFLLAVPGAAAAAGEVAQLHRQPHSRPIGVACFPRSASELSLLDARRRTRTHVPDVVASGRVDLGLEGDDELTDGGAFASQSGDELDARGPSAAPRARRRGQFVRRVASSFRIRRKKSSPALLDDSPPAAAALVPPSQRRRVGGGGVFVLPPNAPHDFAIESVFDAPRAANASANWSSPASTRSPKRDRAAEESRWFNISGRRSSAEQQSRRKDKAPPPLQLTAQSVVPPGSTLKDLLPATSNDRIPVYVRKCVEFIEAEGGLSLEGLYRVPGNQAQVALLEQRFGECAQLDFAELDLPVNAVATALKNFFSYLAEPIVPYAAYDALVAAVSCDAPTETKLASLRAVLAHLPAENVAVLRYFMAHLGRVAACAHVTAMDHRNLAKCWWPTLLRPHFDSFESMARLTPRLEEFAQLLLLEPDYLLCDHKL